MGQLDKENLSYGLPPAVAYGTFRNFLNRMKNGLPSRVDRSVLQSLSGGSQGQLIAALRYFDFIDGQGKPSAPFSELTRADGTDRERLIRQFVHHSYSFVFSVTFDLAKGTRQELDEIFAAQGVGGVKLQRAVAFFLAVARDAGLRISTHISGAQERGRTLKRRTEENKTEGAFGTRASSHPRGDCLTFVVSKLGDLDPNWSEELKLRWLESFDGVVSLLKLGSREGVLPPVPSNQSGGLSTAPAISSEENIHPT